MADHMHKKPDREMDKERHERAVLSRYIDNLYPELKKYTIEKATRPDFILYSENKTVGIEVTEPVTEIEGLVNSVISNDYISGMSHTDLQTEARKHHKGKAEELVYQKFGNTVAVGPKRIIVIDDSKEKYGEIIFNKIVKYQSDICKYDLFIVLAYLDAPLLTHQYEVDEIWEYIYTRTVQANLRTEKCQVVIMLRGEEDGIPGKTYTFS